MIKFVSDLRQVGGCLLVFWFPPPIKLTEILLKVPLNTIILTLYYQFFFRLEIQKDEIDSLKATLKNTLKAKEEDLRTYAQMMEETKMIFLQALKQFRENEQGS